MKICSLVPVIALPAVVVSLGCVGCTTKSGQAHVLQVVTEGGLVVDVEGLAGRSSVSLFSIEIAPEEGEAGPAIAGIECRLFEDLDGDQSYDEGIDRSIGVFAGSGDAHAPWTIGPLIGDFSDGTPCLETVAMIEGAEPRRQSFAVATE